MKVGIDEEQCSGYGLCEETCPDIFKLNVSAFNYDILVIDKVWENIYRSLHYINLHINHLPQGCVI